MYPDTYPDLFAAYTIIWGCLFFALCFFMRRNWKLEKRLGTLESEFEARKKSS